MNSESYEEDSEDGTPTDEFISSYVWNDGHICAAYFNTSTFEMYLTHETLDLRPDFCHLKNLFKCLRARIVLASGPNIFLLAIMQLLDLPNAVDPNQYRLNRLKSLSAATFVVYTINDKTLMENRRRILQLNLPSMSSMVTDQERFNFIEGLVPLHQNLAVHSLGNLLHYLDANWRHLFLRNEDRPIITDLLVYSLNDHVIIDDATFNALQAFSVVDHPSAFKKNAEPMSSKDSGQSLFGLMNSCVSRYGSYQLKTWMYQPIRDADEISLRLRTIEWCRNEKNAVNMTAFRSALRKVSNAGELYAKLVKTRGRPTIWKAFKRTLYHANSIGEICKSLVRTTAPDVMNTHIHRFGIYSEENVALQSALNHLDTIMDMQESLNRKRFCIKYGLDGDLDGKKDRLAAALDAFKAKLKEEFHDLPDIEFTIHYVTEMGFLIAFPSMGTNSPPPLDPQKFKLLFRKGEIFNYTSSLCSKLNTEFGALYVEICEREEQICERLIQHVYVQIADIQKGVRFCAELDAFMALTTFSQVHDLEKPEVVSDRKIVEIHNGRHILLDLQKKFVSNDTSISVEKRNLINVLIAPNASGKSVYLKELAQIFYLAHIGSYVPAERATIFMVDAIYTRIFNPESLFLAKSAFLTEIQEMGNLISNSSTNSLVLVDEMGQGTSEADGKSLLIACLENLDWRADKSPVAFVTTHYVDAYDFLVDKEWISMKTFQMEESHRGRISTYKIIDGKCADRYVKDCAIIRKFIKHTGVPSSKSGEGSISDESITEQFYDTVLNIANNVRNTKIECSAVILRNTMEEMLHPDNFIDLERIFYNWSL